MDSPALAVSALCSLMLSVVGCGHSEEEWQAQLGKYRAEITRADAFQNAADKQTQQLAEARRKNMDLETQLHVMGVTPESADGSSELAPERAAEVRRALEASKSRGRALDNAKARLTQLRSNLDPLAKLGVAASVRKNRILISVPADLLFDPRRMEIKPEGKQALLTIAQAIQEDTALLQRDFQVAAHTDNRQPTVPGITDNWTLSLMRARLVLLFLTAPKATGARRPGELSEPGAGLPTNHWSAAGFADSDPVAPNDSPATMAGNRRVEIVLSPNAEESIDLRALTSPNSQR